MRSQAQSVEHKKRNSHAIYVDGLSFMKLLLTGAFSYSKEQLNNLQALGFDISFVQDERVALDLDVTDIDAVVCNGLFLNNDISTFTDLKFVQLTSAGLDRVPVEYINKHKIKLCNAAGVYSIPMAEWAVLKILEIYKKSAVFHELQKKQVWEKQKDLIELSGKTATIIGFGNVGMEIAKRLKAFGVKVIGVDTRTLNAEEREGVDGFCTPADMDKVLCKSDIVILTLPLTRQTRHFMNTGRLALMKRGSVLINISRGGVIDETALVKALQSDKFLGVALDVFEEEPLPQDSLLWGFEQLIITPHNSYVSDKTNERLFELITKNLKMFINECNE